MPQTRLPLRRRTRRSAQSRRRNLAEQLEARMLLAGDGTGLFQDPMQDPMQDPIESSGESAHATETPPPLPVSGFQFAAGLDIPIDALVAEGDRSHEVVFVDSGIDDYQNLIMALGLPPGESPGSRTEVIVLDRLGDGISQISAALAERSAVTAVHLLSHGFDGGIRLGTAVLSDATLNNYASEFLRWRQSLTDGADILLYGCDVTSSGAGVEFVDRLSVLTGADVAASDDLTGSAHLGGDWTLEHHAGVIQVRSLSPRADAASFGGVLIDIQAGNQDSTFTISAEKVTVPGGDPEEHPFNNNKDETIRLLGTAEKTSNFVFTGKPVLNQNAFNGSLINGNGSTATVDFTALNKTLKFAIADFSAEGRTGISVKENNTVLISQDLRGSDDFGRQEDEHIRVQGWLGCRSDGCRVDPARQTQWHPRLLGLEPGLEGQRRRQWQSHRQDGCSSGPANGHGNANQGSHDPR